MKKILCMLLGLLLPCTAIAESLPVLVSIGIAAGTVQIDGRTIRAAGVGKYAPWGIHEASVIYENPLFATGETRLSVLFDGNVRIEAGPVRSARVTHFQQREEWNAILFLAGDGARLWQLPEMQALSPTNRIFNHHRYSWARACTRRVSGIRAPSNLSVSLQLVQEVLEGDPAGARPVLRYSEQPLSTDAETASAIELNWGKPEYIVRFVWDQSRYLCFRAHAPFRSYPTPDRNEGSGIQLGFENVIVQYVDYRWETSTVPVLNGYGSGTAEYFLQGKKIAGSWHKQNPHSPTVYLDDQGREMVFQQGKTYIAQFPLENTIIVE